MLPRTLVKKKRAGMRLTVFLTREHMDALRSDARVIARGLCEIGGGPVEGQTETLAQLEKHVDEARSFTELAWWVKQITRCYFLKYEDRVRGLQGRDARDEEEATSGQKDDRRLQVIVPMSPSPTQPVEEGQGGELEAVGSEGAWAEDDSWLEDD